MTGRRDSSNWNECHWGVARARKQLASLVPPEPDSDSDNDHPRSDEEDSNAVEDLNRLEPNVAVAPGNVLEGAPARAEEDLFEEIFYDAVEELPLTEALISLNQLNEAVHSEVLSARRDQIREVGSGVVQPHHQAPKRGGSPIQDDNAPEAKREKKEDPEAVVAETAGGSGGWIWQKINSVVRFITGKQ